uniref:Uncharacterized protein n=1 Tax=Panagrolaimus superbus TaxID=310955 RepID=A0A914YAU1_9BILA
MVSGTMKARSDQSFLDLLEYAQFIAGCLFIFLVSPQKSADGDENAQSSSSEDKVEGDDDDDVDYSIIPFRLLGTTGDLLKDSLKDIIGCMDDGLIVFNLAPSILDDVEKELTAQLAVINGSEVSLSS